MESLFVSMLIIVSSYSLGSIADVLILKISDTASSIEKIIFNTILGFGIFSLLIFFIGIAGFIYSALFWVLLIILSLVSIYYFHSGCWPLKRDFSELSNFEKYIISMILAAVCCLTILSFLPITNFDALNYILPQLKYYSYAHIICDMSQRMLFSTYPQLIGMPDMVVMVLNNGLAANHMHAMLGFLTCGMIYACMRLIGGRTMGLLAVLTLITSSVFFDMTISGKIDIGMAMFASAVFYCLLNWRIKNNKKWFILSLLFCAFGFGVKYTGALLLLFPASFYIYGCYLNKKPLSQNIALIFASAAVYLLIISPWFAVNIAFTNNPFSPFLASLFHDKSIMPEIICNIANSGQNNAHIGYFSYLKDIFLGMPVLCFIFFLRKESGEIIKIMFAMAILYLLIGNFVLPRVDRLFFPAFVLLFCVAGYVVFDIINNTDSVKNKFLLIVYLLMVCCGIFTMINEIFRKDNIPYFSGVESKDEYLKSHISSYDIALSMNHALSREDKVLFLGDRRFYYFDQHFIDPLSLLGFSILSLNDSAAITSEMKKNNVKYVLFSKEPHFYSCQPAIFNKGEILNKYFDLALEKGSCSLFKLK